MAGMKYHKVCIVRAAALRRRIALRDRFSEKSRPWGGSTDDKYRDIYFSQRQDKLLAYRAPLTCLTGQWRWGPRVS